MLYRLFTRKSQIPKEYKDHQKEKKKIQEEWKSLRKLKIENLAIKELLKVQKKED